MSRHSTTVSGTCHAAGPPKSPRDQNETFAMNVDEEWALKNWVCPASVGSIDESEVIFDDLYVTFTPGVNAGTSGGTQTVGGVGGVEKSAPAPRLGPDRDPDLRWTCTGDVVESLDSTREEPAFTRRRLRRGHRRVHAITPHVGPAGALQPDRERHPTHAGAEALGHGRGISSAAAYGEDLVYVRRADPDLGIRGSRPMPKTSFTSAARVTCG